MERKELTFLQRQELEKLEKKGWFRTTNLHLATVYAKKLEPHIGTEVKIVDGVGDHRRAQYLYVSKGENTVRRMVKAQFEHSLEELNRVAEALAYLEGVEPGSVEPMLMRVIVDLYEALQKSHQCENCNGEGRYWTYVGDPDDGGEAECEICACQMETDAILEQYAGLHQSYKTICEQLARLKVP